MEHRTVSLADQVFEKLERDILSGKYKRGETLTELKLCEELEVSRTPVREALRRLQQEHIIEDNSKGIIVRGICREDLIDIYAVRRRVEGLAAALAAERINDDRIKELREIVELQEFYVQKKDYVRVRELDSRFHELIYIASGSSILYDTLEPLHKKLLKYRSASIASGNRGSVSVKEHRGIFNALEAHNSALAETLITEHINNAYENIMREVKE